MRARLPFVLLGLLAVAVPGVARSQASPPARGARMETRPPAVWIGETQRGYLGVQLIELSEGLRRHYGAPRDRGVMVSRVEPASPAARDGIAVGDVILEIDGAPITSAWALRAVLAEHREGHRVRLTIVRDGRQLEQTIALEERAARIADLAPFVGHDRQGRLVLLDPSGARGLVRNLQGPETLPPREEIERALETAVRTLRDPRFPTRVRVEIEEKRRLEARIRELERRLAEVEAELARRDRGSKRGPGG